MTDELMYSAVLQRQCPLTCSQIEARSQSDNVNGWSLKAAFVSRNASIYHITPLRIQNTPPPVWVWARSFCASVPCKNDVPSTTAHTPNAPAWEWLFQNAIWIAGKCCEDRAKFSESLAHICKRLNRLNGKSRPVANINTLHCKYRHT